MVTAATVEIEALIERCVIAGVAVRRASLEVEQLRLDGLQVLTPSESDELAALEREVDRLSEALIEVQRPLREVGPALFHYRLIEINRRIEDQLRRLK